MFLVCSNLVIHLITVYMSATALELGEFGRSFDQTLYNFSSNLTRVAQFWRAFQRSVANFAV